MANFRTKARAIDLLGRNQIADLPTAITELWKNGYDAYGDYLDAALYRPGYKDVASDVFTISDDGFGMGKTDILNKWIVIGTESKRDMMASVVPAKDRFGKKERIPLGEKGIGRLSVTYLGNHMLMVSKKQMEPYQMVFMNWRAMENYELYLDEVEVPIEEFHDLSDLEDHYKWLQKQYLKNFDSKSWEHFPKLKNDIMDDLVKYHHIPQAIYDRISEHFKHYGHGTFFVIFDPIDELIRLEEEQKDNLIEDREEMSERTKYVRSALSGLFNPFDKALIEDRREILGEDWINSPSFTIYTSSGSEYDFLELKDFFNEQDFENCENWIDGEFDELGNFQGDIKVWGKIETYTFVPRKKLGTSPGKLRLKMAFWEGTQNNTTMNVDKWHMYEHKGETYSGLYVYRDGFRVLPYGRTDFDFLEFEKRRSYGAGYYYFSHRKMFGYVGITKEGNQKLIDKSGREGFVANDAYRAMKFLLVEFFKKIAIDKYGYQAQQRKDFLEEKKKEQKQEKLIQEEKKRNHQAVVRIRKEIIANRSMIADKKEEVHEIKRQLNEQIEKCGVIDSDKKDILENLSRLKAEIVALKINIPSNITLSGNDSVSDLLYDYEVERKELERSLAEIQKLASEYTLKNILLEEYKKNYFNIEAELNKKFHAVLEGIAAEIQRIREEVDKKIFENKKDLFEFAPQSLHIEELAEENIVEITSRMNVTVDKIRDMCVDVYQPFLKQLNYVSVNSQDGELLGAYKSKEIQLAEKIDTFYELAQVGMAIEVIDHQFNVLYAQIASALRDLKNMAVRDEKVQEIYKPLSISFQHLESNHKMLMPMYRTTRRTKTSITGKAIRETVINFYGSIMDKEDISFVCTERFIKYSIESYESIIIPVFLNVVNNAIYWVAYAQGEKVIKIDVKDGNVLVLNSGSKMSHSELKKCFELFYTQKASGRGIGLYLARKCLNSVDMDIYATDDMLLNSLNGACFVISQKLEE